MDKLTIKSYEIKRPTEVGYEPWHDLARKAIARWKRQAGKCPFAPRLSVTIDDDEVAVIKHDSLVGDCVAAVYEVRGDGRLFTPKPV